MLRQAVHVCLASALLCTSKAFTTPSLAIQSKLGQKHSTFLDAVKVKERTKETCSLQLEPIELATTSSIETRSHNGIESKDILSWTNMLSFSSLLLVFTGLTANANAIEMPKELMASSGSFDPKNFVPVCGASDNFYRFLQGSAKTIVGAENFQEYGPLIASGLLRVRLELCVVESFFNEAVGPFIQQNGLSWILPLHETVETFLAGTVFAVATTFILVGSTKILTVIFTYADFLLGGPLRTFGGFAFDRARGKPVVLDVGLGPFKTRVIGPKDVDVNKEDDWSVDISETSPVNLTIIVVSGTTKALGFAIKLLRDILDAIDLFVGKSLVLWMTAYVAFKFLHFKIFPDFPPL